MRKDYDLLGEVLLPNDVYYGAQTMRTLKLFTPSKERINQFPEFIFSMGAIKKSCAIVHNELGLLTNEVSNAIVEACNELMEGKFNDQLVLDMLSGNDFSPINMNFNEVIACRANEIICGEKGHTHVHPNTHVNMGQSTTDSTYPAAKMALYRELTKVISAVETLLNKYSEKAKEYNDSIKISHTCLQDAAPITMGQFYSANINFLDRQIKILKSLQEESLKHAIGYTVIGTGLGSFKGFHEMINHTLSEVFGAELCHVKNPMDELQYADYFLRVSSALKSTITGISKMAKDIRLMSSGPKAGFGEITIAPVQNGSTFFPGKVNPSLCELVIIACHQVCGYDTSITMAVEAGELDVTPWYPVFTVNSLNSCKIIYNTVKPFAKKCVSTIEVNEKENTKKAERSLGMATVLSAMFGYKNATKVAKYASKKDLPIKTAAVELDLLDNEKAEEVFDPLMLTDVKKSSKFMLKMVDLKDRR